MNGMTVRETDIETRHTDKRTNQKQTLTSGWMKGSCGNGKTGKTDGQTDRQTDRQVDRQKMYEEQTNRQMKELNISLEWI